MTKHTPGPWKVVRSLTCGHLRNENNYAADPYQEWTQADIALIESAPELLAVVKRCVGVLETLGVEHWVHIMKDAKAVIEKAEKN